jgi:hypothetical protein
MYCSLKNYGTHEYVRPVYRIVLLSAVARRYEGRDTYRGDFAAEAEVMNWRRNEAMWSRGPFYSNTVGGNGWQVASRPDRDRNTIVTRIVTHPVKSLARHGNR